MDLNDEEDKKISTNCYFPPYLEFAFATATVEEGLLMVLTPSLGLWPPPLLLLV